MTLRGFFLRLISRLTAVLLVSLLSGCVVPTMVSTNEEVQSAGDKEGVVFGSVLLTVTKDSANEPSWAFLKGSKADDVRYHIEIQELGNRVAPARYKILPSLGKEEFFIKRLPVGNYGIGSLKIIGWSGGLQSYVVLFQDFKVKPRQTTYIGKLEVSLPHRLEPGSTAQIGILDAQQDAIEKLKGEYPSIVFGTVKELVTTHAY